MKWFEFIRLCTTADHARELAQALSVMAREVQATAGVTDCIVVRHALYDGQLGVAVVHDDVAGARQTKAALAVADYLRHYGLVDHQAWAVCAGDVPAAAASVAAVAMATPAASAPPLSRS
jgi:hypothetical protein